MDAGKIVWLHAEAPGKPSLGAPCNGCGVCCAGEPCPVAVVFLRQWRGSCRALQWDVVAKRYRCGMALHPEHYLHWLPAWLHRVVRKLVLRWIAADTGCDAKNEIDEL